MWADRACRYAWLVIGDPGSRTTSGQAPWVCAFPDVVRGSGRIDAVMLLRAGSSRKPTVPARGPTAGLPSC